ncbi:MAG: peptide-binding protein [Candidatus Dormibacteraceae bacterium]
MPRDTGFDGFEDFLEHWSRRDFLKRTGGAIAFTAFMAGGLEAFLAACGTTPSTSTNQNVKKGGHVIEGTTSDPRTFNSVFAQDTASTIPIGMMFAPLLDQKQDGSPIPAIVKSIPKASADGLTYKLDLRNDVQWSDGQPLTADDVVFTYGLRYDPKYADLVSAPDSPDLKDTIDSVTATDKYTVVIKLKKVYGPFLDSYITGERPLPKHVLQSVLDAKPADFSKADFNLNPTVVSGAFTFGKFEKSQQIVLNANPKSYLGRPNIDTYVLKNAPDSIAITNQLKTGELDVGGIDPSLWDDMATATNVSRVSFVGPSWDWYGYQVDPNNPKGRPSGKIFSDKNVRQALYYAIDRQQLADKVYFKQAVPASSILPGTSWALSSDLPKYPLDLAKAKSMLDAAGWKAGADGIRVKDGVRFSFEVITNKGAKTREAVVQVLAEQWKQIGVECTPKLIQFTEYVKTRQTRDFDMVMGGITFGVDPSDINSQYESKFIGKGANRMGYKSTQVDDLLEKALSITDQAKRKEIYVQVQKIVMDDLPVGPLTLPKSLWGISKRVQNFNVGAFNRYASRPWLKDVFVTDGK